LKPKTITDLNELYDEAESIDKEIFAEQRSNVLLIAGEHYSKRMLDHSNKTRDNQSRFNDQKLRLTKNHTYRIVRHYVSNILDHAPGTAIVPELDSEPSDQKAAELNDSVWQNYFAPEYNMDQVVREACQDFCGTGEVVYKLSYDYTLGKVVGYEQATDEEGNPQFEDGGIDPMTGQPIQGAPVQDPEKPIMEGKFVIDRIFAANLLRHPSAKSMRDSPVLIIRHMVAIKDLKQRYQDDPEKAKFIEESSKEDFVVFDTNKNVYSRSKDQCLVREYYWRPCMEYPEGYFQITTQSGILEEGELPNGIYPIVWQGFDEYNTTPRARSIVKIVRPFQAEINRAASSQAMQQVTLGDDKLIYQAGTKLAPGSLLPGVRGVTYQGQAPQVLPGRDGGQFQAYIKDNIMEVDQAAMIQEINLEKDNGADPVSALFQTVAQKKKFSLYIKKFESFLCDLTFTLLDMARFYLPDSCLIPSIGGAEMVNISEFRTTTKLNYRIKVVPREDTLETQLGKQVMIQHALQYVGSKMSEDSIGTLLTSLPYGNFKEIFSDFTIDKENVDSDILLLERGGRPQMGAYDNNEYYVKRLTHRIKKKDFQFLKPMVQQNFNGFLQAHEQEVSRKAQQLKAMESDFIPTGGAMIACDMYVPSKDPNSAPKRVRVPYEALNHLIEQLTSQGSSQQALEGIGNQGALADISQMYTQSQGQALPSPQVGGQLRRQ
jgi:hypothetical protein